MENSDNVIGYIEYLSDDGKIVGYVTPFTDVDKFRKEILKAAEVGMPITPVVFPDKLDKPLGLPRDIYWPGGFRKEKRQTYPYEIYQTNNRNFVFRNYAYAKTRMKAADYKLVYSGQMERWDEPEDIYIEHMFNSRKFAEMTSRDEMFLPRMGLEQRALFIVLPDNDTTFNFIATMLYTQLFDQLFRLADSTPEYNGALPVHVRLMMDEFANVALPKNFKNILAVCRSRNISCDIILQNIAQLKSLFKDDWEGIIGNCDTLLYLGGNEYGTYEYLSKILGKETERTKSQSIGKGSRGSSSDSLQTAGRELCMPDEIRRMRDDECLLLMRSEDPVIDKKYNLLHHPNVKYTPDAGGEPYVMPPDYIGDAATITMDAVAAATAPEITEEMYEQLDYLEKHPEENYYENEENFSQYDQGD